ncbi:SurA N-terminal domain-containing protein [Alsobacter sp. SYSU M60028]|uniref:Parvulin-like PPIase n=1 Tax=Alsobacter ponti TaxID=2962936 RepID=A0ABT1L9P5_9HYPH|nr:peptidyl-prolyl cis-trans isomerase [Alsobacter ponti]MCP8938194.1 SurA N-terminal domain-containing protein [Alsobacter ponti]
MMDGMRRAGQTLIGRIVITVLFGFLILSFAIWGIADMIRNVGRVNVAQVGSAEISAQAFRETYQTELQNLSRRARRAITGEEARTLGLDQQVLSRMIAEAAMDQRVHAYGLALSDETIAKAITADRNFQGADGRFDRNRFDEVIRQSGYNEQTFVRTQRAVYLRQQLADSVAGAMPAPTVLRDAIHRYRNETRAAEYFVLDASKAGDIPTPDEATLQKFFDERKATFRAPDYRKINIIALSPADVANPDSVSDADAKASYEANKARFGTPERRAVQQLVFPSLDEARQAAEKIKAGATFESIAEERKATPQDYDLGLVTREAIIDPEVAKTAFSLPAGTVSDPVEGRFGVVLVRVGEVQPASTLSFEEAAPVIKAEIARNHARDTVQDIHDKVEDQRASARPLAEIAKDLKLNLRTIDAVDRAGRDKAQKPVDLPEREALLQAVFASDIGVDNEAISARDGGYVWFEVAGIEPSRERTLAEVKADVETQWREDQIAGRLASKASEFVKKANEGATIAALAAEAGVEARTAQGVRRSGETGGLPAAAVAQVFSTQVGKTAAAIGGTGQERIVLRVTSADVPQLLSTQQEAEQIDSQVRVALGDDLLNAYINDLQKEIGVTRNETVLRSVIGGGI